MASSKNKKQSKTTKSASNMVIAGAMTVTVATIGIGGYTIGNVVGENNNSLRPTYVVSGSRLAQAKDSLAELKTRESLPTKEYDSKEYAQWADLDGDGCDTREEVLFRDLKVRESDGTNCGLKSGTGFNYYSADTERYLIYVPTISKDDNTSTTSNKAIQIDHIVSKKNAWDNGGSNWTDEKWKKFVNYENNLIATYAYDNTSKGSKDATEWLPSNKKYHCLFAVKQIETKAEFELTVTEPERNKLSELLGTCKVRKSSSDKIDE